MWAVFQQEMIYVRMNSVTSSNLSLFHTLANTFYLFTSPCKHYYIHLIKLWNYFFLSCHYFLNLVIYYLRIKITPKLLFKSIIITRGVWVYVIIKKDAKYAIFFSFLCIFTFLFTLEILLVLRTQENYLKYCIYI